LTKRIPKEGRGIVMNLKMGAHRKAGWKAPVLLGGEFGAKTDQLGTQGGWTGVGFERGGRCL